MPTPEEELRMRLRLLDEAAAAFESRGLLWLLNEHRDATRSALAKILDAKAPPNRIDLSGMFDRRRIGSVRKAATKE